MKGISGVVVAVLLTVIGIVAVLMFWAMFSGMFSPHPKLLIEGATLVKMGDQVLGTITVREVGGASTQIQKIEIRGGANEQITCNPTGGSMELSAGASKTIQCTASGLQTGKTYYLIVYYKVGDGEQPTDPYPVTVR